MAQKGYFNIPKTYNKFKTRNCTDDKLKTLLLQKKLFV